MLAKVPETLPFLSRLDAPLLALSPRDDWRIRDSFEGTWISGATGSGKTSGSGKSIAYSFLKAGYGGLVLCAMPSERYLWERYAAECGRSSSLIVFDASGDLRINFLNYELARHADNRPVTFNVVRMLSHILDVAEGKGGQNTTENPFWRTSMQQLLTNCIGPLWAAKGEVTLADIMRMIATRPKSEEQRASAKWWKSSEWGKVFTEAWDNAKHPYPDEDYLAALDWWQHTFLSDDPRTPANVVATLSARLQPFLSGRMREIFATTTNIVPELTHEGAIIIMDFPVPDWDEAGILAQQLFKYLWQRSVERRPADDRTRPVFLWADECQYFISPYDAKYQALARQKRAATVYITQNLPTFYDRIGSARPEHTAHALLGNFQTKVFHANSCRDTNHYAAELIGKSIQWRRNVGQGENEGWNSGWNEGTNSGWNEGTNESWNEGTNAGENASGSIGTSRNRGTSRGASYSDGGGWSSSKQGGSWSSNYSYGRNEGENDGEGTNTGQSRGWSFGWSRGKSGGSSRGTSGGSSRGTSGGRSGGTNRSAGASEVIDYQVQPGWFTALRNGGSANGGIVEGLLFQGGRRFDHSGSTFIPCMFPQS